jgi:hypothetical protein
MKKVLMTFSVIVAVLSLTVPDMLAQNSGASKRQQELDKWHQEMEEFRARSAERREINELTDSIAGVQAAVAVQNRDFVLEADQVTFKNGSTVFVNSTTTSFQLKETGQWCRFPQVISHRVQMESAELQSMEVFPE